MIADVTINQIKALFMAGSFLFRYETRETIEVYHVNKGPLIFRSIIKKDKENRWAAAMQQLPPSILLLSPIRDRTGELIDEVKLLRRIVKDSEKRRIMSR